MPYGHLGARSMATAIYLLSITFFGRGRTNLPL